MQQSDNLIMQLSFQFSIDIIVFTENSNHSGNIISPTSYLGVAHR